MGRILTGSMLVAALLGLGGCASQPRADEQQRQREIERRMNMHRDLMEEVQKRH